MLQRSPPRPGRDPAGPLLVLVATWTFCCLPSSAVASTLAEVQKRMGSRFEITAVHPDEATARRGIELAYAEIGRLEDMISSWRSTSETSAVNRGAGREPVVVSPELFRLVRRSLKLSRLTDGAFDITFAGVGRLWDFKTRAPRVPGREQISSALAHVGYEKVILDPALHTVYLNDPGARIGFGAIGKGYAANRAVQVLEAHGIEGGVVNAGGDLVAFGTREDGSAWDIGIAHPRRPDEIFARLPVSELAVVTSGDYESFFLLDGKRYAHILDPRTGYPVDHVKSVTVVCPDAELADGLATAVAVLGPERGLALVDQLNGIEALVVDARDELLFSRGLRSRLIFSEEPENPQENGR